MGVTGRFNSGWYHNLDIEEGSKDEFAVLQFRSLGNDRKELGDLGSCCLDESTESRRCLEE